VRSWIVFPSADVTDDIVYLMVDFPTRMAQVTVSLSPLKAWGGLTGPAQLRSSGGGAKLLRHIRSVWGR
jgi:hypothetical protein